MDPPGQSGARVALPKTGLYSALRRGKNRHQAPIEQVHYFPVKAERSGCQRQCCLEVNRVDLAAKRTYILGCFFAAVVVSRFFRSASG